jgi:2-polyprenyl-3-methyl-5-hydroxy-6-metoxy-1,4-benzoquinol methylase
MSTNWDERYAGDQYIYGTSPNQYVRAQRYRIPDGGRVLVAADGEGRNGVWLAESGLDVTSVEQSSAAVRKAEVLAQRRGATVRWVCADLTTWRRDGPPFDAVVAIFAHFEATVRAQIHRALVAALAPRGLLILEAFHPHQVGRHSGGPRTTDMLYDAALIQRDFADLEVLELLEGIVLLDEGPKHQGEGMVVRFVGRKRG